MKTTITIDHTDATALANWLRAAAFWVEGNEIKVGDLAAKPVALVDQSRTRGELRTTRQSNG